MLNRSRLSKHIYFGHSLLYLVNVLCLYAFPEYAAPKVLIASVFFFFFYNVLKEEAALLLNNKVEVLQPTTASLHFLFSQCMASPKSLVKNGFN